MMAGASVAYAARLRCSARTSSPSSHDHDFRARIYERVHACIKSGLRKDRHFAGNSSSLRSRSAGRFEHKQGRGPWKPSLLCGDPGSAGRRKVMARLGDGLRAAVSGGAALAPDIAKLFVGLGLPICRDMAHGNQPVVSTNRLDDNIPPASANPFPRAGQAGRQGRPAREGSNVMLRLLESSGCDQGHVHRGRLAQHRRTARFDESGHLYITGRLKEIIVMSTARRFRRWTMEAAILQDNLFEQVMVMARAGLT